MPALSLPSPRLRSLGWVVASAIALLAPPSAVFWAQRPAGAPVLDRRLLGDPPAAEATDGPPGRSSALDDMLAPPRSDLSETAVAPRRISDGRRRWSPGVAPRRSPSRPPGPSTAGAEEGATGPSFPGLFPMGRAFRLDHRTSGRRPTLRLKPGEAYRARAGDAPGGRR